MKSLGVPKPVGSSQSTPTSLLAAIESVKAASDIYAPVSGTVSKVNDALESRPEIVNESAEELAWICEMTIDDPAELQNLMTKSQYEAFLKQ